MQQPVTAPDELPVTVGSVEVFGSSLPDPLFAALGLAVILVLVLLSGLFSSSEIAMFSLPDHRIASLADESAAGTTLTALKSDPHRLLVTILVGNNLVNVAMSSIATGLLGYFMTSQSRAVFTATFGVTALVLLFGESAPKSYAADNTESWALRVARPLKAAAVVLWPLIAVFDRLTRLVNRAVGGEEPIESSYVTRQEIEEMIETGEQAGVLDEDERELLQRVLRFSRTIVKEVMTPRLDMTTVSTSASLEEVIETCIQSGHERVPVHDGDVDNIIGVAHMKDLVRELNYGERDVELEDLVEPTLHVPESKNVDELLTEMREQRLNLVIVIDEFGTTEGLVTIEDIVEEVVGEILEGEERAPITVADDDTATVRGEVSIDELNEQLGIDLPEGEEFETVAGFIFNRAGRLVDEGETIEYEGLAIQVESVENTRIRRVRIAGLTAYRETSPV
ncbi:MAG: hemolysin related proteins containing CBS domain protein [halophilic archaeon J07HX5]|jgi:Hemolysins and related proteins containing CBS domains|nr:MAG: hemolysin related proteins containing CBS domain protein [halophilic archaeon J07HX5]